MQLTKEITKVIDNFLHEKGIYGVDRDDLEHKIAETINGKECRITTCVGGADGILEVKNGELYIKSDKLDSYLEEYSMYPCSCCSVNGTSKNYYEKRPL